MEWSIGEQTNLNISITKNKRVNMAQSEKIRIINDTLKRYFANIDNPRKVLAKNLMPEFIMAGAFPADHRKGQPIRNLLRDLDKVNMLHAIPYIQADRKETNTTWYFVDTEYVQNDENIEKATSKMPPKSRTESDEYYIISLCNKLLNSEASQQHRFDFLKGDTGRNLPVDAYYEDRKLVIEYHERQHSESVSFFSKDTTVSGVCRDEQRRIYDKRRMSEFPKHGIKVIVIDYSRFGTSRKIKRNHNKDIQIVKQILVENGIL